MGTNDRIRLLSAIHARTLLRCRPPLPLTYLQGCSRELYTKVGDVKVGVLNVGGALSGGMPWGVDVMRYLIILSSALVYIHACIHILRQENNNKNHDFDRRIFEIMIR
jgi:hypothetical protein